ncbi:MAG: helix-turn-helix transcriptional regulator [Lachnospiraceae bacterium]|jgi:transcriptional regulator with XRE-family HTH domain|nr:helix-turn-helix transcriptional regulator [Lachnospiraceae bacterium]
MYAPEDISKDIVQRVRTILDERSMSQTELAARCAKAGYSVTQPDISKFMSLKTKPTLYFLLAISKVFNVSLDYLAGNGRRQAWLPMDDGSFAIDPEKDDAFQNITGEYWAYYESTDPYEDKILEGEISFSSCHGICETVFRLHTGEMKGGSEVIKQYYGQLVISGKMRAMYCILHNPEISELSFVIFRFRNFTVKKMLCRMGLAVTVSAGEQRQPVAHKFFISRDRLSDERQEKLFPFLRFSEDDFVIGGDELDEIIGECPQYADIFSELKRTAEREQYFVVRESDFRAINRKLSQSEISSLRGVALGRAKAFKNVVVTEKEDAAMYGLVARQDGKFSG